MTTFQFTDDFFTINKPSIMREYGLNFGEHAIYSLFYSQCVNAFNGGWCGLSNGRIAKIFGVSEYMIKRIIKSLIEKGLIFIENRQSKRRKIFLNLDKLSFLNKPKPEPEKEDLKAENMNLKAEMADLKAEIADLKARLSLQIADQQPKSDLIKPDPVADSPYREYIQPFFDLVNLSDAQKRDIIQSYAPFAYTFMTQEGFNELESHLKYMAKQINSRTGGIGSIKSLSAYLRKALKQRAEQLAERRRIRVEQPEQYKKPQEELNLPDWYSIIPDEEATAEDLAAVLALQDAILRKKE